VGSLLMWETHAKRGAEIGKKPQNPSRFAWGIRCPSRERDQPSFLFMRLKEETCVSGW